MDIIIQNGKINFDEMKKKHNEKNEEGKLKKDFKDFNMNCCGPYYDLMNSHLHVWRKASLITNFQGPQDYKKIQLDNKPWNKDDVYCSICHIKVKANCSFSYLKNDKKIKKYRENRENLKKENINYLQKWTFFYNRLTDRVNIVNKIKTKKFKIVNNYYKLVYKLLYKPIMYEISVKETKLIYPWELTPYQSFKLENPNYKNSVIFNQNDDKIITTNYLMIE